jgi:type VII secretion-associated protein (TIGR03931 family)
VRTTAPPGPLGIVEVDSASVTVTVVAGLGDHRVLAVSRGTTDAAASVVEHVARASGSDVPRLTGGVVVTGTSRGMLTERIGNLAGQTPVILAEADVISALGGLRAAGPVGPAVDPAVDFRPASPLDHSRDDGLGHGLLGPRPRRRLARAAWQASGPALWGLLSVALVVALSTMSPRSPMSTHTVPGPRGPLPDVPLHNVVAQYDYAATTPTGWQHSGGSPARRRTLLTPVAAPRGSDLISIEQTMLGYDSSAEPDRALREFTERYRAAVAAGDRLDQFTLSQRVGGREVLAYRQRQAAVGAEVQWYVLFAGDIQLSVGCQHTPAGTVAVRTACATVVSSLRTTR